MSAILLTTAQRSALRGLAHGLDARVHIGQQRVSPSVLAEIDAALRAHGLIKVKVLEAERSDREAMLTEIADALFCAPVQHIGRMLVLWRPRPEDAIQTKVTAAAPSMKEQTRASAEGRADRRKPSLDRARTARTHPSPRPSSPRPKRTEDRAPREREAGPAPRTAPRDAGSPSLKKEWFDWSQDSAPARPSKEREARPAPLEDKPRRSSFPRPQGRTPSSPAKPSRGRKPSR